MFRSSTSGVYKGRMQTRASKISSLVQNDIMHMCNWLRGMAKMAAPINHVFSPEDHAVVKEYETITL